MKKQTFLKRFTIFCPLASLMAILTGCSSSPMKERLEQNFVYNCSLELLDKHVSGADAEKICSASHQSEMDEKKLKGPAVVASTPAQAAVVVPVATPAVNPVVTAAQTSVESKVQATTSSGETPASK